jgi:hypothetical protein
MRIERKGPVSRLTPRLERFFVEALGGEALDAIQDAEERKADFRCLRGLLAVELKTLEEDGSERLGHLTAELRMRPDWPVFLGAAPLDSHIKHLDKPDEMRRRVVERIGRAIKNHMRKASKQLAAHAATFPRKNMAKAMVLANEDHELYDPETVIYIVRQLLLREEKGLPLCPAIDAVLFLTERHAAPLMGRVGFPIVCIEAPSIERAPWKRDVTELFMTRWAAWNGMPLYQADPQRQRFTVIDPIPEQMKRYEGWELDYKRARGMRNLTDDELRERFDEIISITSLALVHGSPFKPG